MNLKLTFLVFFLTLPMSSFFNSFQNSTLQPPIILIMDASGSMWGKIDGNTKIAIARDVVHQVLDEMDPSQSVGLVVYGHRNKSDCEDIETLVSPGINNHDHIKFALNKINPTGKTPLANTAIQVIEQLKKDQLTATLILISDGEESCNGDLCEVVKKAKESGVEFVLHIVGFDLGDSDQLALECAAKEGGGIYINAENGSQLSEALIQTTEMPILEKEPTLSVKVMKNGSAHDASVKLTKASDAEYFRVKRTYTGEKTNPAIFRIEPGTYNIEAAPLGTDVSTILKKDVVVEGDKIKEVVFDFTAGKISILSTGNGHLWDSVVKISKSGESKSTAKGRTYKSENSNPMIKELSPGFYDIKLSAMSLIGDDAEFVLENVEVLPGQSTQVEHNYDFGEIQVYARNNGMPWDCVLNVNAGSSGKKYLAGGRTGNNPDGKSSNYLLTPGYYNVLFKPHGIYGHNSKFIKTNIEVEAGSVQDVIQDYESGMAKISVKHRDEFWISSISIYQDDNLVYSKRSSTTAGTNPLEIHLIPGSYRFEILPKKLEAEKQVLNLEIKKGDVIERLIAF